MKGDDYFNLMKVRENVDNTINKAKEMFDKPGMLVLDIAPEIYLRPFEHATYETLDLVEGCTYKADLCNDNSDLIPSKRFDLVICTEVLEHTNDPWSAVRELARLVKKDGCVMGTTPWDLYIHNPKPDNWRFSMYGLELLLKPLFEDVVIEAMNNPNRTNMPFAFSWTCKNAIN